MVTVKHQDGRADLSQSHFLSIAHEVTRPWGVDTIQGDFIDGPMRQFNNGLLFIA